MGPGEPGGTLSFHGGEYTSMLHIMSRETIGGGRAQPLNPKAEGNPKSESGYAARSRLASRENPGVMLSEVSASAREVAGVNLPADPRTGLSQPVRKATAAVAVLEDRLAAAAGNCVAADGAGQG